VMGAIWVRFVSDLHAINDLGKVQKKEIGVAWRGCVSCLHQAILC